MRWGSVGEIKCFFFSKQKKKIREKLCMSSNNVCVAAGATHAHTPSTPSAFFAPENRHRTGQCVLMRWICDQHVPNEINDKWWDMTTQVRAPMKAMTSTISSFFLSPFAFYTILGVRACGCVGVCVVDVCVCALLYWCGTAHNNNNNNIPFNFAERAYSFPYLMPKIAFSQRIFSFIIFIRLCLCLLPRSIST